MSTPQPLPKPAVIQKATEQDLQLLLITFGIVKTIRKALQSKDAASGFLAIHEMYRLAVDRIYLTVARLFDGDNDSGGIVKLARHLEQQQNRAAIVAARDERMEAGKCQALTDQAKDIFVQLRDSPPIDLEGLKYVRDKTLAHRDLAHLLKPQVVNSLNQDQIEKLWRSIADGLNKLNTVLRSTHVAYDNLLGQMTTETSNLIRHLGVAKEYEEVIHERFMDFDWDATKDIHEQTRPRPILERLLDK